MATAVRRAVRKDLLAGANVAPLRAQPSFARIIVQDQVPLDLRPRAKNISSESNAFITRTGLSPAARMRLAQGLRFDHLLTVEPLAPGPAILSCNSLVQIPGDRRMRVELKADIALHVLGPGADFAGSVAAARDEVPPRGIVVGADPQAEAPPGRQRVGAAEARPVLWTKQIEVHGDFHEGARRTFDIMSDWPPFDPGHSNWRTIRYQRGCSGSPPSNWISAAATSTTIHSPIICCRSKMLVVGPFSWRILREQASGHAQRRRQPLGDGRRGHRKGRLQTLPAHARRRQTERRFRAQHLAL